MSQSKLKESIKQPIFLIIFRIICELFYIKKIVPSYSYIGYVNESSVTQYLFSWLFLLILISLLNNSLHKKDILWQYFLIFLFCIKIVPLSIMLGRVEYEPQYLFCNFIFWVLFLGLYCIIPSFKIFDNDYLSQHKSSLTKTLNIVILLFSFTIIFISGKYAGFRLHTSLFDVYDIRFEQREMPYPVVFRYILTASTVLCPLILTYFMERKRWIVFILFIGLIYLNFSIEGQKSIVFSTIIGILLNLFYKGKYKQYIFIILSLVLFACLLIKSDIISTGISFVVWRVFFCPSGMDYQYFVFFNKFEPDYYRNSILRRLGFESPYSNSSVDIAVGEYFNPSVDGIRANNGLLSEAFANFGMVGCFILPIILVIYIKVISSCSKGINEGFICLIAFILSYTIVSTFIPATFLSTGVLFMLIFLICYRANIYRYKN